MIVRLDQREPRLRPLARVERDRDVALEQRLERALDEALGAAERRVALADDREAHQAARSSASSVAHRRVHARRPAASSGTRTPCRRRSRRCRTAGTGCAVGRDDARRHAPRPPFVLARRAEQRDRRRAHRRGDVHRRRVDADEQRAPARSRAASSRSVSVPARSTTRARVARRSAATIASTSARSRGSGAPVIDDRVAVGRRCGRAAPPMRSAGQHLNSQREPGCDLHEARARASACARAARRRARRRRRRGRAPARLSSSPGWTPMRRSASRFASTVWRGVARGSR